jgi:hypothetical protein
MRQATETADHLLRRGKTMTEADRKDFDIITGDLGAKIGKLQDEVARLQPEFKSQEAEEFQKRLSR